MNEPQSLLKDFSFFANVDSSWKSLYLVSGQQVHEETASPPSACTQTWNHIQMKCSPKHTAAWPSLFETNMPSSSSTTTYSSTITLQPLHCSSPPSFKHLMTLFSFPAILPMHPHPLPFSQKVSFCASIVDRIWFSTGCSGGELVSVPPPSVTPVHSSGPSLKNPKQTH